MLANSAGTGTEGKYQNPLNEAEPQLPDGPKYAPNVRAAEPAFDSSDIFKALEQKADVSVAQPALFVATIAASSPSLDLTTVRNVRAVYSRSKAYSICSIKYRFV